jgi:hypothetical protein
MKMSLIDRYIAEVGRHLPEKDRSDIEAEIRSTLEDVIEEKGGVNETNIDGVLREFGDPVLLAQKYSPSKRYLIGPYLYDAYIEVLKRVLGTALPIFLTVNFLVMLTNDTGNVVGSFLRAAGNTFEAGLHILFWATVGFIIAERKGTDPGEYHHKSPRAWTPDQLPALPKKRQISVVEVISNITLVIGGIVLVALSSQILRAESNGESIPFLNPDLWKMWLPVFFVLAGLTLLHELFKLWGGNWTRPMMITNVALGLAAIIYLVALITTQQVVNPLFLSGIDVSFAASEIKNVTSWSTWTVNITAAVIISIYVWDMVESVGLAKAFEKQNK